MYLGKMLNSVDNYEEILMAGRNFELTDNATLATTHTEEQFQDLLNEVFHQGWNEGGRKHYKAGLAAVSNYVATELERLEN